MQKDMHIHLPEELENSYDLVKVLYSGRITTVYLARQKRLQNLWAVKQVRKNGALSIDFNNEPVLLHNIRHPLLPYVIGSYEDRENLYIVEEYVPGITLADYLEPSRDIRAEGPSETDRQKAQEAQRMQGTQGIQGQKKIQESLILKWFLQLSSVLSFLHHQIPPVIHRDIKPSNIMLLPDGNLKLLDFGLAVLSEEPSGLSSAGQDLLQKQKDRAQSYDHGHDGCGTLGYAAPEQFNFGTADARSDIYALGATMFHLLTGKNPADTPYSLPAVRKLEPSVSEEMEYIIDRCTRNLPEERYQSADALMHDLLNINQLSSSIRSSKGRLRAGSSGASGASEKNRKTALILCVSALVLIASAAGIFFYSSKKGDLKGSSPSPESAAYGATEQGQDVISEHIISAEQFLQNAVDITDRMLNTGDLNKEDLDERSRSYSEAASEYSAAVEEGISDAQDRLTDVQTLMQLAAIDYDMLDAFERLDAAFREDDSEQIFHLITETDTVKNSYCNVHHISNALYSTEDASIVAGWPWTYYGDVQNGLPSGKGAAFNQDRIIRVRLDSSWQNGSADGDAVETMENPSPASSSGNFFLTRIRRGEMKNGVFDGEVEETLTYKITRQDASGHLEDVVTEPFTIRYTVRAGSPVPVSAEDLPDQVAWVNERKDDAQEDTDDIYAWSEDTGLLFYISDYQSYIYRIGDDQNGEDHHTGAQ